MSDAFPNMDHLKPGHRSGRTNGASASGEEKDGHQLFKLTWLADMHPIVDAGDFVQGLLTSGSSAVIYGESSSGKTFWTANLALHVATGKLWNGRRIERGGVIYLALEGASLFRNRVTAWRDRHAAGVAAPFAAIESSVNLLDPEVDRERLIATITAAAGQIKVPVRLIVIGTLSRALAGGNENSPEAMGALVAAIDAIRRTTGACVLLVHHSGKDVVRGARGHSLLRAAIDTEIEVTVDEVSGVRTASVVKQRDLAKGDQFGFKLESITLGHNPHGEAVTTCLVNQATPTSTRSKKEKPLGEDAQGVLDDIIDMFADPEMPKERVPMPGFGLTPMRWSPLLEQFCGSAKLGSGLPHAANRTSSLLASSFSQPPAGTVVP